MAVYSALLFWDTTTTPIRADQWRKQGGGTHAAVHSKTSAVTNVWWCLNTNRFWELHTYLHTERSPLLFSASFTHVFFLTSIISFVYSERVLSFKNGKVILTSTRTSSSSGILGFSINFCPVKTNLSGNTIWPKASVFQKIYKMEHFWHLWLILVHS